MASIIWLPIAQDDLKTIFQYIKKESPIAAAKLLQTILNSTKHLEAFYEAAPIEPTLIKRSKVYRFVLVKRNYKILFFVKDQHVYIAAVWDCRQNPKVLKQKIK